MTYNPSKPAPNDLLSDSQLDIQTNFSVANTSFGKNHFPFDNGTVNNGKHNFVQMPVSAVIPAGLAALEGTIYTKSVGAPPISEVYYTPDNSTNEYQITRTVSTAIALFGTNTAYPASPVDATRVGGWTFLPGGLLLQYGRIDVPPSTSQDIVFPIAYTSFVTGVNVTGVDSPAVIKALTLLKLTVTHSNSNTKIVYWTAIGK